MKLFKHIALASLVSISCSAHAISLIGPVVSYNGHDYVEMTADNWTNSEDFAVSLGGHLVAINDAAENTFINTTFGSQHALWIGFRRTGPSQTDFAWTNGDAVTFTNWAWSEPNNCCGGEDYTHTYTSGEWNDLDNFNGYAGDKYGILELVSRVETPEPSPLLLVLSGLGLLGWTRRRTSKTN
jgi:hypothetical protein